MTLYRVKYTISGDIEVAAKDADDAYQQVRAMTTQTLCDLGDPWVHVDEPIVAGLKIRNSEVWRRAFCGVLSPIDTEDMS